VTALIILKKNLNTTIKDLKKVNHVVEKIRVRPNHVEFTRIVTKNDLMIHGLTDASYKSDDKSISGVIIMLGNKKSKTVNPLFWKSKIIKKVCHSAKDLGTRSMVKLMDNVQFCAIQLEQLMFGKYEKKIPIKLYTDSKPMLESIGSTHQVEEKLLQNSITDMKELLSGGEISSFSWLDSETDMVADALTKEGKLNMDLQGIVLENKFWCHSSEDNMVQCQVVNGGTLK
jgi:hypothetical protein